MESVNFGNKLQIISIRKQLGWRNILGYGAGDVANNFFFAMGTLFLLNYYTDIAGIPILAAGTLLAIVRIYDAIMDIVAGHLVDQTMTRWGRFRPFILFGALPLMALGVAVFSVPQGWDADGKLLYAYVTYAMFGTAYSFINIPYGALASAMTQEPNERARLGICRTFMAVCTSSFLIMIVGPSITGLKGPILQTRLTQFTLTMAVMGVLLYILCFMSTRENVPRKKEAPKLKESIGTLVKNRPLQILCTSALCILSGYTASSASLVYYARYVLDNPKQFFLTIGTITLFMTFVSAPLVPAIVGKMGKKHAFLMGLAIAILGYLALFCAPVSNNILIFGSFAIASLGVRISMAIMWALEADTVEYGEWCTGIRIEGLNYSFFSLTRKCGQSIGGLLPAFLLSFGGYIPNMATQSETAQQGILQSVALVPIIAFAAAFIIMLFYPLTDKNFAAIVDEIKNKLI